MQQRAPRSPQSGSSFFIILFGIFLFAALSYAVMQGSRTSESNLSREQSRMAAQEIIAFGDTVAKAVQSLVLRDCSQSQLNFENNMSTLYDNTSAPEDGSCNIFSPTGGKVSIRKFPDSFYANTKAWTGEYTFTTTDEIIGVGTSGCSDETCTELIMYVWDLKPEVCREIMIRLGYEEEDLPEVFDLFGDVDFNGTFSPVINTLGDNDSPELRGMRAACVHQNNQDEYDFYQVLIAR